MGAAASVEGLKPVDASDLRCLSLQDSKAEIMRLRARLGHLAAAAGFGAVVMDASDLCLGKNELEDHERCCTEIAHIRAALQLATQKSKRCARAIQTDAVQNVFKCGATNDNSINHNDDLMDSDSESSSVKEEDDRDGDTGNAERQSGESDHFVPIDINNSVER